jgi:hypothetical protein
MAVEYVSEVELNALMRALGRTMSIASPRAGVAASMDRTDTVFLIDFMILSIPGKSPNSRAWSWMRRIMDSTEWQLLSFSAIGCVANVMLVIFSYSCRAASKAVRKRDCRDSRLIFQVVQCWLGRKDCATVRECA